MTLQESDRAIRRKEIVRYDEGDYKAAGLILRYISGKRRYSMELRDLKADSVVVAGIERVTVAKDHDASK